MGFIAQTATITIATRGRGFHEITGMVTQHLPLAALRAGVCTICVMHTSASLLIFENADPSAKADIEAWMRKHVPDGDPAYTHSDEGPDDMPSHIRAAITATTLTIPVSDGSLMLGRWQGIYLWEHRAAPHRRMVAVACMGEG
ncbi:MAG TPA: secondary thiamine-phosphate synthase enzyme YjbQ [Phycisphaerales bacterium]|nr:secondary thiamine-phosphate synthase enzyme YjbQ [Phycisphaerales bacterium]